MRRRGPQQRRRDRAGFTLMEVIVALGLFALISVAGFTLLDGVIRTRDRLDGRLERIAELQRAMYLITLDFEQVGAGPITMADGAVAFSRRSERAIGGRLPVSYRLSDGALYRSLGGGDGVQQRLVTGVSRLEWSFHVRGQGWRSDWPPNPEAIDEHPAAVAMTITLEDVDGQVSGPVRRVVQLPEQP